MAGAATLSLGLPDVYVQRRVRVRAAPRLRTDVAGIVGFEPRLRPAEATLELAPARHRVTLRVESVELRIGEDRTRLAPPASGELVLSEGAGEPLAADETVVFAVVATVPLVTATGEAGGRLPRSEPFVVAGGAGTGVPPAPDDAAVEAALDAAVTAGELGAVRAWTRLADVRLRREGDVLWPTVHPCTGPIACEDWGDYLLKCGDPAEDGTRLAAAVRAFFANGGDRCHIATVRRPFADDDRELDAARQDMVGLIDAGIRRSTGVARLLLIDEVALVAAPDLHAQRPGEEVLDVPVPPSAADADFRPCGPPEPPLAPATGTVTFGEPVYGDLDVLFATELAMLELVARSGLGVQLVLTPPLHRDPATGRHGPPDAAAAKAWRARFPAPDPGAPERDRELSFGACYWPWLRTQETVGAPVRDEPPLGAALGIIARRDLERGPFVGAANERVRGVVGTTHAVSDADHRELYDASAAAGVAFGRGVNVFRPFPTRGIELWGSRTLAGERCLRHLPVRRGLSAIERQAAASLGEVVFEPHGPLLTLRITHMMTSLLMPLFETGALRGATPEEAFVVRCDDTVNPPEAVAEGRLVCEVGVALASPAEFIVFRLGRQDQAIEVTEP